MKVCVLMGGVSEERDISIKSGTAVLDALMTLGMEANALDVKGEVEWIDKNLPQADVYFIALHGKFGEDGQIQGYLQEKGIAYTGSGPLASKIAMDKCLSRKAFQENGLPIAHGICLTKGQKAALNQIKLPAVVKPSSSGSSFGISIADNLNSLVDAIENAFKFSDRVLIEDFIKGKEITVGILNGQPLTPIEIRPVESAYFDLDAKYTKGKTEYIVPANISQGQASLVKDLAKQAFDCIGCRGFGRVDIILSGSKAVLLEVNTIPGMTELSLLPMAAKADGIGFAELCKTIIQNAKE